LSALPLRQLVQQGGASKDLSQCISVMTFNILAQCYTRSEFFPSVKPKGMHDARSICAATAG
jgi:mRNA deadenylase 3'-5' endonuclease subunit Ccr4